LMGIISITLFICFLILSVWKLDFWYFMCYNVSLNC
jgi:hypothetical protein